MNSYVKCTAFTYYSKQPKIKSVPRANIFSNKSVPKGLMSAWIFIFYEHYRGRRAVLNKSLASNFGRYSILERDLKEWIFKRILTQYSIEFLNINSNVILHYTCTQILHETWPRKNRVCKETKSWSNYFVLFYYSMKKNGFQTTVSFLDFVAWRF